MKIENHSVCPECETLNKVKNLDGEFLCFCIECKLTYEVEIRQENDPAKGFRFAPIDFPDPLDGAA